MEGLVCLLKEVQRTAMKFLSRKFATTLFGMFMVVRGAEGMIDRHLDTNSLVVVVPALIGAITLMCITYVTGEAKIDLQANLQANANASVQAPKAG